MLADGRQQLSLPYPLLVLHMIQITLISRTTADTQSLISASRKILGRSITKGVDRRGKSPDSLLDLLSEFEEPGSKFEDSHAVLKHVSYGFLVVCLESTLLKLITVSSSLHWTIANNENELSLAMVTGTLEEWRTAIINGSVDSGIRDVSLFFNKIYEFLKLEGLGTLFDAYHKVRASDSIVKFLPKK